MNADAPTHAVSNHCAALAVDVVSPGQIAPGTVDDLCELSIGGFLLCFAHAVRFAEHLIEVGYDCCITELREVTDIDLHIPGNPEMVMHDQHAGTGFSAVRVRDVSRDAVFFGREIAHPEDRKSTRLNSSHLGISYAVFCLKKKKKSKLTHRSQRQY